MTQIIHNYEILNAYLMSQHIRIAINCIQNLNTFMLICEITTIFPFFFCLWKSLLENHICFVVVTIDLFTCIKYVWQICYARLKRQKILYIYNFVNEWIKHGMLKRLKNRKISRRHFHLWKYLHSNSLNVLFFTVAVCFLLHQVGTHF